MYKLFLCIRYLWKLMMAYFATFGVALCVAMMLIAISVMNGFLDKIETAAKGLSGDIVVDAPSLSGLARYDEFIARLRRDVPQVQAASPYIRSAGILGIPGTEHRHLVEIGGIRLPDRADTTDFENGLFVQRGDPEPTFDPPIASVRQRVEEHLRFVEGLLNREEKDPDGGVASRVRNARMYLREALACLKHAEPHQKALRELQDSLDKARREAAGANTSETDMFAEKLLKLEQLSGFQRPANRAILGLGLPALSFRTKRGETIRVIGPGGRMTLTVIPFGRKVSMTEIDLRKVLLTVVDDCTTDVSSIDSSFVYMPFETLQRLNNMDAEYSAGDPPEMVRPPRCGQIHIKVKPAAARGQPLMQARDAIEAAWSTFIREYPDAGGRSVRIQTWRQYQAKFIGPIQQQRTLTVIMFSIMSVVSVVLIFVILYMIVHQKTRDVGVLKAIGASNSGVAWIFLSYGAVIGLMGSILGCIGGYYFVRYINEIQDFTDRAFGFSVWSREVFMFAKIPNEVKLVPMLLIVAATITAGIVGALVPAIRAGRMQPVEALRYE